LDFSIKIICLFWLFLKQFDENCLLLIQKSTVLVFSNLVFQPTNGYVGDFWGGFTKILNVENMFCSKYGAQIAA
jgi:hypothetical protein